MKKHVLINAALIAGTLAAGAGISWLHRNAEVLDKHIENGRFAMTVRVDISKRDITIAKFGAVPSLH